MIALQFEVLLSHCLIISGARVAITFVPCGRNAEQFGGPPQCALPLPNKVRREETCGDTFLMPLTINLSLKIDGLSKKFNARFFLPS